jgi:hypothetical protein
MKHRIDWFKMKKIEAVIAAEKLDAIREQLAAPAILEPVLTEIKQTDGNNDEFRQGSLVGSESGLNWIASALERAAMS